ILRSLCVSLSEGSGGHRDLHSFPTRRSSDLKIEVLPNDNKQAVDMGLKYVNNDACYPSLIVVGQIMDAILSGNYDTDHLAVIIRSEEHTSELQSRFDLVCRLLLEKKNDRTQV